ncbi:uncharacterized protein LOC125939938 [Dermacentor silvarum]|uniref:uncharacterized protein LOC125939938 n=1 Tax=Dermacentor silvarum TaxID=543639 RepID=UPI0021015EB2|nr:uncharacterized protein LOC125939938 [Dermacentor silvarum]
MKNRQPVLPKLEPIMSAGTAPQVSPPVGVNNGPASTTPVVATPPSGAPIPQAAQGPPPASVAPSAPAVGIPGPGNGIPQGKPASPTEGITLGGAASPNDIPMTPSEKGGSQNVPEPEQLETLTTSPFAVTSTLPVLAAPATHWPSQQPVRKPISVNLKAATDGDAVAVRGNAKEPPPPTTTLQEPYRRCHKEAPPLRFKKARRDDVAPPGKCEAAVIHGLTTM